MNVLCGCYNRGKFYLFLQTSILDVTTTVDEELQHDSKVAASGNI